MRVPKPSSTVRTLVVALAITTLAGCSILPRSAPVQIWRPETGTLAPSATRANFSLRVGTPNVTGMLDHSGIVVLPKPGEVSTYQGARWSEPPALLVRQRLVDAFMAANLTAVTTDDDHFFADYSLSGNLRAFQTEYRHGVPVIVVRYDALLRRSGSRQPLAFHSFVITRNATGAQVPQVVAAFGAADDALAHAVVAWTLVAVGHTPPAPAPGADAATRP
ncbi:MAG: ABC transporter [Rhodanobacteraceae bacterium]|nr:MAG: ABC transporter [Rhodanobacteraceae bacterium]